MKLDFAVFAIHATVASNGVFNALEGGITAFMPSELPIVLKSLFLLAKVSFSGEEIGKDFICVAKVVSPSGKPLFPELTVAMNAPDRGFKAAPSFSALYNFGGIGITEAGVYKFCLSIGDHHLGEAELEIRLP